MSRPNPAASWIRRLALSGVMLAVLVVGAWFVSRAAALWAIDNWVEQQQRLFGRRWTCGTQTTAGFPFRLDYVCSDIAVETISRRSRQEARAAQIMISAPLYNPLLAQARLQGPLVYRDLQTSAQVTLEWSDLTFDIGWNHRGIRSLLSRTTGLSIQPGGLQNASAARIETARLDIHAAGEDAVEIALDVAGGDIPALARLTGSTERMGLTAAARMDKAEFLFLDDLLSSIEDWRMAGGKLTVSKLAALQGAMSAELSGALELDEQRRARGNLSLSASGIEDVLKRYGVNPAAASIGSALTGFFARREETPAPQRQAGTITLPLWLKDGRVFVGPVRLPLVLFPLY